MKTLLNSSKGSFCSRKKIVKVLFSGVAVWGICGVRELQFGGVAVWGSHGVGGSCGVWELWCGGVAM